MATIIAGRFDQHNASGEAIEELLRAGFAREHIATFYVTPQGQHATYPVGGDHDKSPGAKDSGKGAAMGAAAGAAVGVATTPFLGPLGAVTGGLVGAHVGGLVGGLSQMKESGETDGQPEEAENIEPIRQAGMMLAISVGDQEYEDRAINVLRSFGAIDIERAQGTITNGDWVDFDPVSRLNLVDRAPQHRRPAGPHQRA